METLFITSVKHTHFAACPVVLCPVNVRVTCMHDIEMMTSSLQLAALLNVLQSRHCFSGDSTEGIDMRAGSHLGPDTLECCSYDYLQKEPDACVQAALSVKGWELFL